MTRTTDLSFMMAAIGKKFPFTQGRYPNENLTTPEKTRVFAIRHSLAHMAKTTGRIAEDVERYDHRGTSIDENLRLAAAQSVVNALNLANALGMSAQEITRRISEL